MEVSEAMQNPAEQYEEAISGNLDVISAIRKQYLESARGHYLSALSGLNAGKQEQAKICSHVDASSVSEDNAFEQATELEQAFIEGQLEQAKTFAEMDMQIHLAKGVLKESEDKLQAMKTQFNKTLAKNTKAQIAEMVSRIGAFRKEVEAVDASAREAVRLVPSELGGTKELLLKGVPEGSSLQRMVESLKAELDNLKKEHAELKDRDSGADFTVRNTQLKHLQSKSENECFLANEAKVGQILKEASQDQNEGDFKIRAKWLKRQPETSKISVEVEKRPRVALAVDEAKEVTASASEQSRSLPGRIYSACVSTSESTARMMISEDELESSSQKLEMSDKLRKENLTAIKGRVEPENYDCASEFSIRDYVFAARNKDISMNWPFSQKNLQLCLKHGVKDVLPPFQPMDPIRDCSGKRYLAETSLQSEESNLGERPLASKNRLVPVTTMGNRWSQELAEGYRDSDLFPSGGERELAFKTTAIATSQSEVESVSTSNLPMSEVSDERGFAASAANNKTKSSASHLSSKKCRIAVKLRVNSHRSTAEDITSACTAPSEGMTSKICPVCQTFSSSSNTTLNAHIDQCLSSQSTPNWTKNSKLMKPRIKSRKIRLMADICATAPRCTLEDLDRRNGTNWAINADFSQNTDVITEGKNPRLTSRHVVNNCDDGAVYIDSNGRKIRILSKFNDTSPSSLPKTREDHRPKKLSKKGKARKFLSPNRKRRLAKHLKYMKVTRQRKRFSSLKVKGRFSEACRTEEATIVGVEKLVDDQPPAPFAKAQERKNSGVAGSSRLWIPSKRSNLPKKNDFEDTNENCRPKVQATKDLLAGNDLPSSGSMHVRKHLSSPKKSLATIQRSLRTPALDGAGMDQKGQDSYGSKSLGSPSLRAANRESREPLLVSLKSAANRFHQENTNVGAVKSMDSTITPESSLEREVGIQADSVGNADSSSPGRSKFVNSCNVRFSEAIRPYNSETDMVSPSPSYQACQPYSKQKNSALEQSCGCRGERNGEWCSDFCQLCGAMPNQHKNSEITDILCRDEARESNGTNGFADESQHKYGFVRSSIIGLHSNLEATAAIEETVMSLSRSADPELHQVTDASDPCSGSLDDHDMFYGNVVGDESAGIKAGDSDFNLGRQSCFPAVDPIPIPGPPGSDLPSFSDMGSDDVHSLGQSSGDGDNVDGDSSDSPLSATSTISNLGVSDDPNVSEPESSRVTPPNSGNVFPERVTFLLDSSKESMIAQDRGPLSFEGDDSQCCCSLKEGIPWSSALNSEGCQILGRQTTPIGATVLDGRPISLDSRRAVLSFSSCQRGESENLAHSIRTSHQSASPSAPILRLMGKDLMVINKQRDDHSRDQGPRNVGTNRQILPFSEISCGVQRSWQHWAPHSTSFIGPLLNNGHDPRTSSVRHCVARSGNMGNDFSAPEQASGGVYINKHIHDNFNAHGAAPLQR